MSVFKTLREKRNVTQQEAADAFGVARSTVAMWEINLAFPEASRLPLIAEYYRCSISDLYPKVVI